MQNLQRSAGRKVLISFAHNLIRSDILHSLEIFPHYPRPLAMLLFTDIISNDEIFSDAYPQ